MCSAFYLFRHSWNHKILQLLDQVSCMSFPLNEPASDLLLLAIKWSWVVLVTVCKHAIGQSKFGQNESNFFLKKCYFSCSQSFFSIFSFQIFYLITSNSIECFSFKEHQAAMSPVKKWNIRSSKNCSSSSGHWSLSPYVS